MEDDMNVAGNGQVGLKEPSREDAGGEFAAELPQSTFMVSKRLWFRAPEAADAPLLAAWRNDPRLRRTTRPRFPSTAEAARTHIESRNPWQRGTVNDHADFVFGPMGASQPCGIAGLFGIDWLNRHAEFGITIGAAHWNRGYGREVAARMLEYAFEELNLRRVELQVFASNERAIKTYQAVGFVHEGTRRQADSIDGRWEDVLLMAVLLDEWLKRHES
jgi:RimJ/RimL family protein N-acetyltransferase